MNILNKNKQSLILSQLTEGNSIRSIERMTGVHRDTIMRLLVRAGDNAKALHDERMRDLQSKFIQCDEIWTYVGCKQKRVPKYAYSGILGDQYVFVAMDADTKLVPSFLVGKRSDPSTMQFIRDLADRVKGHFMLSSDSFPPYTKIVPQVLGDRIEYGQVHKVYNEERREQKRYSPAHLIEVTIRSIIGEPDPDRISTSYIERQNLTMRMSIRRMTRLTNAFSKKLENLVAAINLHFYSYNFIRVHGTVGMTPAMAAGITDRVWGWDAVL